MTATTNPLSAHRVVYPPLTLDFPGLIGQKGEGHGHGHQSNSINDHHLSRLVFGEERTGGHPRAERPVKHDQGHADPEHESVHKDDSHDHGSGSNHEHDSEHAK